MPEFDIKCLISGDSTDGRVAVFEERVRPGEGPPLHIHRNQMEVFHIIEGKFRFHLDGQITELEAGGSVLIPAGAVHSFRNIGDEPSRIHFEILPAGNSEEGFDRLVNEGASISDIAAFFDDYGMDLAGPPID